MGFELELVSLANSGSSGIGKYFYGAKLLDFHCSVNEASHRQLKGLAGKVLVSSER